MASKRDVLKQDIDKGVRSYARMLIKKIYQSATDSEEGADAFAEKMEQGFFEKLAQNPKNYLRNLVVLDIFLNPKDPIGQFSVFFREKVIQNVYSPIRITELNIPDIFPEVFLSKKSTVLQKLDIYKDIERAIDHRIQGQADSINQLLYGAGPKAPTAIVKPVSELQAKDQTKVHELCYNPYWEMKRVNIIICKQDNKFYCLDTERLLVELADAGTATNYFTGDSLPEEIVNNLRSRYEKEIDNIKTGEADVDIGKRTKDELVDLEKTFQELRKFKEIFNKETVQEGIELFGLTSVEDPSYGGVKDILNTLPPMVVQDFYDYTPAEINKWLDNNIADISGILHEKEEVKPVQVVAPAIKKTPEQNIARKKEAEYVKKEIINKNTVASRVYKEYIKRLEQLIQYFEDLLAFRFSANVEARAAVSTQLQETTKLLKNVREKATSISGIISIVKDAHDAAKLKLDTLKTSMGMHVFYPQENVAAVQEYRTLKQKVEELSKELERLTELKNNYLD